MKTIVYISRHSITQKINVLNDNENAQVVKDVIVEYLEQVKKFNNDDNNADFLNLFLAQFQDLQEKFVEIDGKTDDEKLILVKKGIILVDQFHESLTGEVLWYHVGGYNNGVYTEKRFHWSELFTRDAITL